MSLVVSSYIELLQKELERVGMKYRFEKSDFRFPLLKGKQTWFKALEKSEDENNRSLFYLPSYILGIPMVYFWASNEGYLFLDLEELYRDIIKEYEKRYNLYTVSEYSIGNIEILRVNYEIFDGYSAGLEAPAEITAEEFLNRWHKYKLDFAILIHEFDCRHPQGNIKYRIRKHTLEFKGIYLQHSLDENGKYLTVSFVASILEGLQALWERFKRVPGAKQINVTIFTKTQFLNLIENKIIAPFYKNVFGAEYEPLVNLKNYEERARKIIENLNKILVGNRL